MKSSNSIQPSASEKSDAVNNSMEQVYELETIDSILNREEPLENPKLMIPNKDIPKQHIRVPLPKYRQREKLREVTGSCCHSFYDAVN